MWYPLFGRDTVEVLFLDVRPRAVDRAVLVFGRGVDRVELYVVRGGVDEVVHQARGDDDRALVRDRVLDAIEHRFPGSLLEAEELVDVGVHLGADLAAGRNAHHHQLAVLPGVEHAAEAGVLQRLLFDVCNESFHGGYEIGTDQVYAVRSVTSRVVPLPCGATRWSGRGSRGHRPSRKRG